MTLEERNKIKLENIMKEIGFTDDEIKELGKYITLELKDEFKIKE